MKSTMEIWNMSKQTYYKSLCEVAEEMNEIYKAEGSKDRAVVLERDNRLQIFILVPVERNEL